MYAQSKNIKSPPRRQPGAIMWGGVCQQYVVTSWCFIIKLFQSGSIFAMYCVGMSVALEDQPCCTCYHLWGGVCQQHVITSLCLMIRQVVTKWKLFFQWIVLVCLWLTLEDHVAPDFTGSFFSNNACQY